MSQAIVSTQTSGASTTSFLKRPLDIVSQFNPDGSTASFASLATNQLTLIAGVYRIQGWAKGCGAAADNVGIRLYNVTAGALVANTEDAQQIAVASENVTMFLMCAFTLAGTTIFELQGRGSAANANGFGINISGFTGTFAMLNITKTS